MKYLAATLVLLAVASATGYLANAADRERAGAGPLIIHDVYFSLKDNSAQAKEKLVGACKKYLTNHPGAVFFAAGTLAEDLDRPVNDRDWDVGLHIVFKDKASHDQYQEAERHKKFIEENRDNWKKVRVFDTRAGSSNVK
jgi:hypothetical protein